MNFLCENCKQKYHVADEKLRGREVTKFKCKKCEHIIEVRGDAVGTGDDTELGSTAALSPSVLPASGASVAPVAPAAPRTGKPTGSALPTSAPKPTTPSSKPTGTSLPTTVSKPAGSALPTSASKPTASPLPTATTATKPAASTGAKLTGAALPTAGGAARAVAPSTATPTAKGATALKPATSPAAKVTAAPSALRSSITAASAAPQESAGPRRTSSSASTSALLNPSETGWYAGIRDVPVGPLTRAELATKIDAGDITSDTLVWREGLDDWRPLSAVNELSDLLREASKRVSDTMLGAQPKRAPSNVVPISRANTQKEVDEPEESTRLTSLSDLIATAEGGALPKKPAARAEPAPEGQPEPQASEPKAPAPTAAIEAPATAATASESSELDDPFFMGPSKKTPAPAAAAPMLAPPAAQPAPVSTTPAKAALYDLPPIAERSQPAPAVSEAKEKKSGGVPMGVVVVLGGLVVAAGGGGLYMGTRLNQPAQPAPQQPPASQPPVAPPRLDPQVGAQINIHEPTPPTNAPPTQPTPPAPSANSTTTATPSSNTHGSGGSHARGTSATSSGPSSSGSGASGRTTSLTPEQLAQLQQLNAAGGVAGTAGGGPVGSSARVATSLSSASEPVNGPTGGVRASQVLETFRRTNVVGSCWQQQITRNPAHPAERISVTLTVNTTGRATAVSVSGANNPALAQCIETRARSQNYGPGGNIDAQATFNLAIGN